MNGIVHPCSHPEDRPPPSTEEEMMLAIFKYTDRVVNMVRPRKLLLIAVGTFATAMPNSPGSTLSARTLKSWKGVHFSHNSPDFHCLIR